MPLNSVVVTLVALAAIAWLAFLVASGVRGRGREEVAPNASPFRTDDQLETRRLEKVQASAVVLSAFLALSLPIYYLTESNRQEDFVEQFDEESLERGAHVVEEFGCGNCHGADFGGGAAAFVEKRSGITVSWAAPALDDIFFRHEADEVKFWIVFGRPNSPMPAWGLAGGGPLDEQQVNDIVNYLQSIQISQEEALARIQPTVDLALNQLAQADAALQAEVDAQQQLIADIQVAPERAPLARDLADRADAALAAADEGIDADGDGLADTVEQTLTDLMAEAANALGSQAPIPVTLDPASPQTAPGVNDARAAREAVAALESLAASLEVTAANQVSLLEQAETGAAYLQQAGEERLWEIDLQGVADATFGGDLDQASRAVGLFNGYCARCHTSNYSAGVPFVQEAGSGGIGPALWNGRATVQFLTAAEMSDFIINGSELNRAYGVNGMGSGRMPAFGKILSQNDIDLIVQYLRGETLRGVQP